MWRLPEGWHARLGKIWRPIRDTNPTDVRAPDGTPHSKKVFYDGTAITLGIKPIRQQGYDKENYDAKPEETETETEVVKGWKDIKPKMVVNKRKEKFGKFLKETVGIPSIRKANEMIRELTYLDPDDPEIAEWQTYKSDLKSAYGVIKGEVVALKKYDDLVKYIKCEGPDPSIEYGWRKHIPKRPDEEGNDAV